MLSQLPFMLSTRALGKLALQQIHMSTFSSSQGINTVPNTVLLKTGKFTDRVNTCINFLPSGYQYVIERFGKFNRVAQPGLNIFIPLIDRISYMVEMRELCLRISPEQATTEDNVAVLLGGNIFIRFVDAEKAAYGSSTPISSVVQFAQAVMRTTVGGQRLDKLFSERTELNNKVIQALHDGCGKWGCEILRFEITDLEPSDKTVAQSLHKQSTAERERREKIINAEAFKREIELKSDAYKYEQIIKAEGDAQNMKILADAKAYETIREAEARETSINKIAAALAIEGGPDAMRATLTAQYIRSLEIMGAQNKSTLIVPHNLGNIASALESCKEIFDQRH